MPVEREERQELQKQVLNSWPTGSARRRHTVGPREPVSEVVFSRSLVTTLPSFPRAKEIQNGKDNKEIESCRLPSFS